MEQYKGFEIEVVEEISGYGWSATPCTPENEGMDMAYPQRDGQKPYSTAEAAVAKAKWHIIQALNKLP